MFQIKNVLERFINRNITEDEIIHFSFNQCNKSKIRVAIFFTIKMLGRIYEKRSHTKREDFEYIIKVFENEIRIGRKISKNRVFVDLLNILHDTVANGI